MKFWAKLVNALSSRDEYKTAAAVVEEALLSGRLRPSDRRHVATELMEPKGWPSHIDGIDWVEVSVYAEEKKMPFESVGDLLSILKSMNKTGRKFER
jgi:hypothetical protein